ncbi:MAG: sulfatase-like hydrolase/transferase [bacterium]
MKKRIRQVAFAALVGGVLAGLFAGVADVRGNEYWERGLRYLAFHTLTEAVNRYIYVFGVVGAACFAVFSGLRLAARRWLLVPLYLAGVAALAYWARDAEIDYKLDVAWREMDSLMRVVVAAWGLWAFDLAAGKGWLAPPKRVRMLRVAVVALAIPIALNAAERAWLTKLEARLAGKPDFMIFMIDALRADRVGAYGYGRDTTPTLDSLAAAGVQFENATSNANMTRLTVPSIFTLLYPSTLGMASTLTMMSPRTLTVAELMKNAGYQTLAYIPNPSMKKRLNFDQGFDVYDDKIFYVRKFRSWESMSVINERVLDWFRGNRGRRFFIYIHSCDAHAPYSPPPPYDTMFYDPSREETARQARPITEAEYARMHGYQRLDGDRGDLNYYKGLYDGEVRYTDDKLGELLAEMRRLNVAEKTIFFFSADHGEGFLEHGEWDHGHHAYDEVIHVPLIMTAPDARFRGSKIVPPVHTFDMSATVLDLAGVPLAPEFQAKSMMPLVRGDSTPVWEYSYIESDDVRALRSPQWKFIQDRQSGEEMLFDLAADSAEYTNLVAADTLVAGDLRRKMAAIVKGNEMLGQLGFMETSDLDAETIEQLKALGYIE